LSFPARRRQDRVFSYHHGAALNVKLIIEYDGTGFAGWQVQPGKRTVQGVLEQKLSQMLDGPVTLYGSSRTDAGVHAKAQVANFRTEKDLPLKAYAVGLNAALPRDVAVRAAEFVDDKFHARFDAKGRLYHYSIITERSPLRERYAWRMTYQTDPAVLRDLAARIIGKHDFQALTCAQAETENFIVNVQQSEWVIGENEFTYIIKADRFLHNLVRILIGTMIDMARGYIDPKEFDAILASKDRTQGGRTAPPHGLCLMEVYY
jgi:tRNA pseudouridine38-40 synthase